MSDFKIGRGVRMLEGVFCSDDVGKVSVISKIEDDYIILSNGQMCPSEDAELYLELVDEKVKIPDNHKSTDPGTVRARLEQAEKAAEASHKLSNMETLTITLPKGTTRLEGEFEGYRVIVEKV